MNPWDIFAWDFPDIGTHPAVIFGTDERLKHKPKVNVLLCSSQHATRRPELHEVILDESDGLDLATLCKCDLVYAVSRQQLLNKRGTVAIERRHQIAERVIRALGFAGL
jgi:hypothetical protein